MVSRYTDSRAKIPEAFPWKVLENLSSALLFLHEGKMNPSDSQGIQSWKPIIHRDIQISNIFLTSLPFPGPGSPTHQNPTSGLPSIYPCVILGDFGSSITCTRDKISNEQGWDIRRLDYDCLSHTMFELTEAIRPRCGGYTDSFDKIVKMIVPERNKEPDAVAWVTKVKMEWRGVLGVISKDEVLLMAEKGLPKRTSGEGEQID